MKSNSLNLVMLLALSAVVFFTSQSTTLSAQNSIVGITSPGGTIAAINPGVTAGTFNASYDNTSYVTVPSGGGSSALDIAVNSTAVIGGTVYFVGDGIEEDDGLGASALTDNTFFDNVVIGSLTVVTLPDEEQVGVVDVTGTFHPGPYTPGIPTYAALTPSGDIAVVMDNSFVVEYSLSGTTLTEGTTYDVVDDNTELDELVSICEGPSGFYATGNTAVGAGDELIYFLDSSYDVGASLDEPLLSGSPYDFDPLGDIAWNSSTNHLFVGEDANVLEIDISGGFGSALPVVWASVHAQSNAQTALQAATVKVSWVTATESNNQGFYVTRSADGRDFADISYVLAMNNPNGAEYHYIDRAPLVGKSYYRLRQVDFDGTTSFSTVVSAIIGGDAKVTVYPTPVSGNTITVTFPQDQLGATWIIWNQNGQVVRTFQVTGTSIPCDVTGLPAGNYVMGEKTPTGMETVQIVVAEQ